MYLDNSHHPERVFGLNATDKTPMYGMPLIYVFGGWGFGVGASIFCIGVLGNGILSRDPLPGLLHFMSVFTSWFVFLLLIKLK